MMEKIEPLCGPARVFYLLKFGRARVGVDVVDGHVSLIFYNVLVLAVAPQRWHVTGCCRFNKFEEKDEWRISKMRRLAACWPSFDLWRRCLLALNLFSVFLSCSATLLQGVLIFHARSRLSLSAK
jgi:hypothetical protein